MSISWLFHAQNCLFFIFFKFILIFVCCWLFPLKWFLFAVVAYKRRKFKMNDAGRYACLNSSFGMRALILRQPFVVFTVHFFESCLVWNIWMILKIIEICLNWKKYRLLSFVTITKCNCLIDNILKILLHLVSSYIGSKCTKALCGRVCELLGFKIVMKYASVSFPSIKQGVKN